MSIFSKKDETKDLGNPKYFKPGDVLYNAYHPAGYKHLMIVISVKKGFLTTEIDVFYDGIFTNAQGQRAGNWLLNNIHDRHIVKVLEVQ